MTTKATSKLLEAHLANKAMDAAKLDQVVLDVARFFGVKDLTEITQGFNQGKINVPRKLAIVAAWKRTGFSVYKIADYFGCHGSMVDRYIKETDSLIEAYNSLIKGYQPSGGGE